MQLPPPLEPDPTHRRAPGTRFEARDDGAGLPSGGAGSPSRDDGGRRAMVRR